MDRALLSKLRRLGFLFVRKVRALLDVPSYLRLIGAPGAHIATASTQVTGHVWGENE